MDNHNKLKYIFYVLLVIIISIIIFLVVDFIKYKDFNRSNSIKYQAKNINKDLNKNISYTDSDDNYKEFIVDENFTFSNDKDYVVIYWSPICKVCDILIEDWIKVFKEYNHTFNFYFVSNINDREDILNKFNNKLKFDLYFINDNIFRDFKFNKCPTILFYKKNNNLKILRELGIPYETFIIELTTLNNIGDSYE